MSASADNGTLTRFALYDLKQTSCRCGAGKAPLRTFCRECYYSLPEPIRKALYKRIGQGYEGAYSEALKYLAAMNRLKLPEWVP